MAEEREIMPDEIWGKKVDYITKNDVVGWLKQLMQCEAAMNGTDNPGELVYISHHVCDDFKTKYSFVEAQVNLGNIRQAVADSRIKTADGKIRSSDDFQKLYDDVLQQVKVEKIQKEVQNRMDATQPKQTTIIKGGKPQ